MTNKLATEAQAEIDRLERDIRQLDDELRMKQKDLKRHRKTLKLSLDDAARGGGAS